MSNNEALRQPNSRRFNLIAYGVVLSVTTVLGAGATYLASRMVHNTQVAEAEDKQKAVNAVNQQAAEKAKELQVALSTTCIGLLNSSVPNIRSVTLDISKAVDTAMASEAVQECNSDPAGRESTVWSYYVLERGVAEAEQQFTEATHELDDAKHAGTPLAPTGFGALAGLGIGVFLLSGRPETSQE